MTQINVRSWLEGVRIHRTFDKADLRAIAYPRVTSASTACAPQTRRRQPPGFVFAFTSTRCGLQTSLLPIVRCSFQGDSILNTKSKAGIGHATPLLHYRAELAQQNRPIIARAFTIDRTGLERLRLLTQQRRRTPHLHGLWFALTTWWSGTDCIIGLKTCNATPMQPLIGCAQASRSTHHHHAAPGPQQPYRVASCIARRSIFGAAMTSRSIETVAWSFTVHADRRASAGGSVS